MPVAPTRRRLAARVAALVMLAAAGAPASAFATSFMLVPGAPTAGELAERIAALEQTLAGTLKGAALADLERGREARARQHAGDAAAYAWLERRIAELEARRRRLSARRT